MSTEFSAEDWLNEKSTKKLITLGLERIGKVFDLMFKNQKQNQSFPLIITIGGTNGKGTTGFILSELFRHFRVKVGWFSSPHLSVFNERIRINGKILTSNEIIDSFEIIEVERKKVDVPLSYFEYTALAALDLFLKNQVDVMVMEVGLGGRLDAVNILDADIAIITSIGLDHMHFLGESREKIADEKAGIFREGRTALIGLNAKHPNIKKRAEKLKMQVYPFGEKIKYSKISQTESLWEIECLDQNHSKKINLKLPSFIKNQYQLSNVSLAATALMKSNLVEDKKLCRMIDLSTLQYEGRMQSFQKNNINYLVDVAHNPQAMQSLIESLDENHKGKMVAIVAFLQDKKYIEMIELLDPWVDSYALVQLDYERAVPGKDLAKNIAKISNKPIVIFKNARESIKTINNNKFISDSKQVVAVGCFALAEQMIQNLKSE